MKRKAPKDLKHYQARDQACKWLRDLASVIENSRRPETLIKFSLQMSEWDESTARPQAKGEGR